MVMVMGQRNSGIHHDLSTDKYGTDTSVQYDTDSIIFNIYDDVF